MHDQKDLKLSKWPFLLGDLVLLGAAVVIEMRGVAPMGIWPVALMTFCVAAGAVLTIVPFVMEYRLVSKLAESSALADVVGQMRNLERLNDQIAGATARWQSVQEVADRVASTSKAIAERMSAEAKAFTEFMHKANDTEKATLRLEAEKLRRAEGEWVHVLVRVLDHIYALHLGAARSGQPNLIAQVDQFQQACREAARRIGLAPFAAGADEPFDGKRHQVLEGKETPSEGAIVGETIATGYTFQGRLLRPALVRLQEANGKSLESNGSERSKDETQNPMLLNVGKPAGAIEPG